MASGEQRLSGADAMRAAACLLVFGYHLSLGIDAEQAQGTWLAPLASLGHIGTSGVALFFVLSGFLLARPFWINLDAGQTMPDLRVYALRRLARIAPGYWLALTASFALSVALLGFPLTPELMARYASGLAFVSNWTWQTLFPVEGNAPLWSISFEVFCYLLLPLGFAGLFAARRRLTSPLSRRLAFGMVIIGSLVLHVVFTMLYALVTIRPEVEPGLIQGAKIWMPRYNSFGLFAMFAIGALAAGVQVQLAQRRGMLFDAVALGGLVLVGLVLWLQPDASGYLWMQIPYSFPFTQIGAAMFLAAAPQGRVLGALLDRRPVRHLAQISFGLYLWHNLVIEVTRRLVLPNFSAERGLAPFDFCVAALGVIAASWLLAELSLRYVEAPALRWARKLEDGAKREHSSAGETSQVP